MSSVTLLLILNNPGINNIHFAMPLAKLAGNLTLHFVVRFHLEFTGTCVQHPLVNKIVCNQLQYAGVHIFAALAQVYTS